MDYENLRHYMAKEEQEQMDALVARAVYRRERKKEAAYRPNGFQYFRWQFAGMAETEKEDGGAEKELWEEEYFEIGIERLLRDICSFCLKHGLCKCACCQDGRKKGGNSDMINDELPL